MGVEVVLDVDMGNMRSSRGEMGHTVDFGNGVLAQSIQLAPLLA